MVELTSQELNYLIFRYLKESGLTHSAFSFGLETGMNKSAIDDNLVSPGALVKFVQRGMQYLELEANLSNDDADSNEDFQFLSPLNLITKDAEELRKIIKEKKETILREKSKGKEKVAPETDRGPEPMEICPSSASSPCEIPNSDVAVLQGHTSEVYACAWNPAGLLLASGSGDSTARIWTIESPSLFNIQNRYLNTVLRHFEGKANEKSKDVTTLDWNGEGTLLATGSYDGHARIWSRNGELISTLNKHKKAISSLKWNKRGNFLLSGSVDKTAIVWDVKKEEWKQQFKFHSAPALDVDWRNNNSFATCSADSMIYVWKVGEDRPIKAFSGHQAEVNAIKWDDSGSLLASCSDDSTVKIWNLKYNTCLLDFKKHTKEIYTIRWSPTGVGPNNRELLLASASFDSTIKLWNVDVGCLLSSLNGHRDPVYSVAFSPNGKYLASGSLDKFLHIWSVKETKIVKTFSGQGSVFEVCWNKEGDKIAACFSNNVVCVLDFRM